MTGGRGLLFDEGPSACPFVALDRDRDRRADEPDSRHRCYATPAPEPRALAHQRKFCLTPTFPACPIFQDWAIRAAARPVPLRPIPPALALTEEDRPVGEPELTITETREDDAAGTAEQVGMFDDRPAPAPAIAPAPPMPTFRLTGPADEQATDDGLPIKSALPAAIIPPPDRSARPAASPMASVARSQPAPPVVQPPKPTPSKPIKTKPTLRREDIVPSWERSHYDMPDPERSPYRRRRSMSRVLVLVSALAILALVALALLIGPGLFFGAPAAQPTGPTPSAAKSASQSAGTPSPSATPQATWLTYTIKLNDSLYAIAARFNITYEQLLAANPQIKKPDYIRAGDVINIPPPNFVVPSASAGQSASASP